jgi:hypothetical protein
MKPKKFQANSRQRAFDRRVALHFVRLWPRRSKISPAIEAGGRPRYFAHRPYPRQQAFLDLLCEEAFFGGAAGGGKSDAILMAALQYVDVPGYSALILRRDFPRLSLPGAIMDRAQAWLAGTAARWNRQEKTFRFPSGAKLQFGYLDAPRDRYRYMSSEFQFIGWDELTEFDLGDDENNPYLFLFNRLRKTGEVAAPLRVRSASNPGNIGHLWVRNRFIKEAGPTDARGVCRVDLHRAFVPSRIADNPALDEAAYRRSLMHLPPVTRQRLMEGDWDIAEGTLIDAAWFARYETADNALWMLDGPSRTGLVDPRSCQRFATIDTAGSSRQKTEERKGKPASYSVIGIWDACGSQVFLRHVTRGRFEWPELKARAIATLQEWKVLKTYIENQTVGPALAQECNAAGCQAETISAVLPGMTHASSSAKLDRAIAAGLFERLERRELFLPKASENLPWLAPYEVELTSWRGETGETSDQIDMTSYAVWLTRIETTVTGGLIK